MSETPECRQFVVVLRASTSLVFSKEDSFRIEKIKTQYGYASITYKSRWINGKNAAQLPGQLWIEVVGDAPDIKSAVSFLGNIGLKWLSVLSLVANAAIGHPTIELAFESASEKNERDFFQAFVRPERHELSEGRMANIQFIADVFRSILANKESERLIRAANQYRFAIDNWRAGTEALALAHCWMAIEALTKVQISRLHVEHGTDSNESLASLLSIKIEDLDATVRKRFLLNGDIECYRKAKKASDGFEHGFLEFEEISANAADVAERLAKYVRSAIFSLSGLSQQMTDNLLSEPYDSPLGTWPLLKFITGKLIGSSSDIAPNGQAYPFMRWRSTVESCSFDPPGRMNVKIKDSLTAELGEGVSFRLSSVQVWRGGSGVNLDSKIASKMPSRVTGVAKFDGRETSKEAGEPVSVDDPAATAWATRISSLLMNVNTIKHVAIFWIAHLNNVSPYEISGTSFSKHVRIIKRLLRHTLANEEFLQKASLLWDEALELDGISEVIIRGAPAAEGLVCFMNRTSKGSPIITDLNKVSALNEDALHLAKSLVSMLAIIQTDDYRAMNPLSHFFKRRLFS